LGGATDPVGRAERGSTEAGASAKTSSGGGGGEPLAPVATDTRAQASGETYPRTDANTAARNLSGRAIPRDQSSNGQECSKTGKPHQASQLVPRQRRSAGVGIVTIA
jgi:hypothetical protein